MVTGARVPPNRRVRNVAVHAPNANQTGVLALLLFRSGGESGASPPQRPLQEAAVPRLMTGSNGGKDLSKWRAAWRWTGGERGHRSARDGGALLQRPGFTCAQMRPASSISSSTCLRLDLSTTGVEYDGSVARAHVAQRKRAGGWLGCGTDSPWHCNPRPPG